MGHRLRMIAKSVRDLVGNTPLYEITSFDLPAGTRILAKLEWMNPGGSVKDRLGIQLVDAAIEQGHVTRGGTIIEPTAGNTGIGLALAAKNMTYKSFVSFLKNSVRRNRR